MILYIPTYCKYTYVCIYMQMPPSLLYILLWEHAMSFFKAELCIFICFRTRVLHAVLLSNVCEAVFSGTDASSTKSDLK